MNTVTYQPFVRSFEWHYRRSVSNIFVNLYQIHMKIIKLKNFCLSNRMNSLSNKSGKQNNGS